MGATGATVLREAKLFQSLLRRWTQRVQWVGLFCAFDFWNFKDDLSWIGRQRGAFTTAQQISC